MTSFFGIGGSAPVIEIILDGIETRKHTNVKDK